MNINAAIHNLVSLLSALVSFQRPDLENSIYPYYVCVPPVFMSNPMVLEEAERESRRPACWCTAPVPSILARIFYSRAGSTGIPILEP